MFSPWSLKVWQWEHITIGVLPVAGMGVYCAETRDGVGGIVVSWSQPVSTSCVGVCGLDSKVGCGVI